MGLNFHFIVIDVRCYKHTNWIRPDVQAFFRRYFLDKNDARRDGSHIFFLFEISKRISSEIQNEYHRCELCYLVTKYDVVLEWKHQFFGVNANSLRVGLRFPLLVGLRFIIWQQLLVISFMNLFFHEIVISVVHFPYT